MGKAKSLSPRPARVVPQALLEPQALLGPRSQAERRCVMSGWPGSRGAGSGTGASRARSWLPWVSPLSVEGSS